MFGRNSGPIVLNFDNCILFCLSDVYSNVAIRGRILHSIVDKVDKSLPQNRPISYHCYRMIAIKLDGLVLLLCQHLKEGRGLAYNLKEVNLSPMQLNTAGIGASQSQKTVHQLGEAIGLFEHASDRVPVVANVARHSEGYFADTLYRSQRGPQFVGGVSGESSQLIKRTL